MVIRNPGAHADSHWDDTSSSVTGGFIGHAVTSPDYQNAPLTIIRDFLTMLPDQQADLWASMAFNEAAGRVAKDAAARIIRAGDSNEMKSIFSSVEKHTDFLASEAIRRLFTPGKKTFPFARLKGTKPCTVYLVIPPERLDSQRRLIRLFLNLVISEMTTGGRARVPCLMLVDELLPLGFSAEILKAMSLLAGYNLIIWSFIQGLGALRDLYANSAEMFVANSRAVQVFNVSDEITTKYVSNYMGPRSLKYVRGAARITGQAPMLRTPAEVAREIGDGLQLVLRAGKPPLLLRKVPYYDSGPWKADARIPHFMAKWWNPFHGCFTPDPDFA
jgi:type IV secretion system protein VirD4